MKNDGEVEIFIFNKSTFVKLGIVTVLFNFPKSKKLQKLNKNSTFIIPVFGSSPKAVSTFQNFSLIKIGLFIFPFLPIITEFSEVTYSLAYPIIPPLPHMAY